MIKYGATLEDEGKTAREIHKWVENELAPPMSPVVEAKQELQQLLMAVRDMSARLAVIDHFLGASTSEHDIVELMAAALEIHAIMLSVGLETPS